MPEAMRTFQCRVEAPVALDAMADLLGRLERRLYAEIAAGAVDMNAVKRDFIASHGLTARQFNALRVRVEGAISGVREALKTQADDIETRIKAQDVKIKKLDRAVRIEKDAEKRAAAKHQRHQRKRRRAILLQKADALRARLARPAPGICFGSRKLFRAQFEAEANGCSDHGAWAAEWRAARSGHVFCLGSKSETAGNQTCQGWVEDDGSISVKLRLPNALIINDGKHLILTGLRFRYCHAAVAAALAACARNEGDAVTWRFVRDGKGWRAFVSVRETHAEPVGDTALGALGVDVNADHLAVAVADPHGNPVAFCSMPTPVVGMRADCRDAIYGDAAKVIVDMALARRVPIVLESLDFRRKRAELETSMSPRYARMLSGLAYAQIGGMIRARAMRLGVRVIERNPAYTSLIGDVKFSARYGVSIHLSAALAIARRGMGLSERVPSQPSVSLGGGVRVTLLPPARMGRRHVWASWAKVARGRKAALAGRSGSAKRRSSAARPARAGPAADGSLEQDRLFLDQLTNPEPAGAIPAATSSPTLLGRRTARKPTYA